MTDLETEILRRRLLDEVYAMAIAGMGAALLDESEIRHADAEALTEIAKRYGIDERPKNTTHPR